MRALRLTAPTTPDELGVVGVPTPRPGPGEALVEVRASGVNRSDVLACRGVFPGPYPRTLGREYAGLVIEGPQQWLGRLVWGAGGGDLGLSRDGTHAEYLVVPVDSLTAVPEGLGVEQAGGSALSYFTAAVALERTGSVGRDAWVVVSGAVGGVGHAAVALAEWAGARVISVVRNDEEAVAARERGDEHVVTAAEDITRAVREVCGGTGAAHVVDAVGGPMTRLLLDALAPGGALCVLSAPPEPQISLDVLDFYRRDLTLNGLNTSRLTARRAAEVLAGLAGGFEAGELTGVPLAGVHDLTDAATAYRHVQSGHAGRPVLTPRPALVAV